MRKQSDSRVTRLPSRGGSAQLCVLARHRDRLPFADVIGARYGLADANRALDDVAALRVTKAIIEPR